MGAVIALIAVGVGLIGGGFYWRLYDDIIASFISDYIVSTSDAYYVGSLMLWDIIPYALVFLGIFCLVISGLVHSGGMVAQE